MLSRRCLPRAVLPATVLGLALLAPAAAATGTSGTDGTGGSEATDSQSCAPGSVDAAAKAATAVFTGTVRGVAGDQVSAQETDYVHMVVVDRVYKPGRSAVVDTPEVELITQRTNDRCSLGALDQGERYVVFANLSGEVLLAAGDSGTSLADASLVAEVETLLGSGRPPVPPEAPTATLTPVAGSTPTPFARAAVPGAGLVLVGLLGLLVTRRLNRAY